MKSPPKTSSKYKNRKVTIDDIRFDSKKEGDRYLELKLLLRAGQISHLKLQPEFKMVHHGILICKYRADFEYRENGKIVVEDVKSEYTRTLPVYRIKKKMMKAFYGVDVREV